MVQQGDYGFRQEVRLAEDQERAARKGAVLVAAHVHAPHAVPKEDARVAREVAGPVVPVEGRARVSRRRGGGERVGVSCVEVGMRRVEVPAPPRRAAPTQTPSG